MEVGFNEPKLACQNSQIFSEMKATSLYASLDLVAEWSERVDRKAKLKEAFT